MIDLNQDEYHKTIIELNYHQFSNLNFIFKT